MTFGKECCYPEITNIKKLYHGDRKIHFLKCKFFLCPKPSMTIYLKSYIKNCQLDLNRKFSSGIKILQISKMFSNIWIFKCENTFYVVPRVPVLCICMVDSKISKI